MLCDVSMAVLTGICVLGVGLYAAAAEDFTEDEAEGQVKASAEEGTGDKETSLFFVGNSYTAAAGGQQHLLTAFLAVRGAKTRVGKCIAAGETLMGHLENNLGALPRWRAEGMTRGAKRQGKSDDEVRQMIEEQHAARAKNKGKLDASIAAGARWDIVVLQVAKGRDDPEKFQLRPAVEQHADKFRASSADCTIVLYETWVRQNRPEQQAKTSAVCRELARKHDMRHAPAGPAMHKAHAGRPQLKIFRTETDSHPGVHGAYLIACVLYATVTGESPVGLPARLVIPTSYDFGDKEKKTDEFAVARDDAKFLQQVAWETWLASQQPPAEGAEPAETTAGQ